MLAQFHELFCVRIFCKKIRQIEFKHFFTNNCMTVEFAKSDYFQFFTKKPVKIMRKITMFNVEIRPN